MVLFGQQNNWVSQKNKMSYENKIKDMYGIYSYKMFEYINKDLFEDELFINDFLKIVESDYFNNRVMEENILRNNFEIYHKQVEKEHAMKKLLIKGFMSHLPKKYSEEKNKFLWFVSKFNGRFSKNELQNMMLEEFNKGIQDKDWMSDEFFIYKNIKDGNYNIMIYVKDNIKYNRNLLLVYMEISNGNIFEYIDKSFKKDKFFVIDCINNLSSLYNIFVHDKELNNDDELFFEILKKYLSEEVKNSSYDRIFFNWVGEEIKNKYRINQNSIKQDCAKIYNRSVLNNNLLIKEENKKIKI